MKIVNKDALSTLIENMEIESINIEQPLDRIDASSPEGKEFLYNKQGYVDIRIKGWVRYPDKEL